MTARAEISLYITCMHGVNTGLGGPAAIGHSQNFWVRPDPTWYIFPLCWGVETTLMDDDCFRRVIARYRVLAWY